MLTPKNLHSWQLKSAKLLAQRKQCALFADPGDGKTITTLTALAILKPKRTLIIAPAKVCSEGVWPKEAASWSHTKAIKCTTLQGLPPKKRLKALREPAHFHVISYSLIPWLVDALKPLKLHQFYDAVVFDELSNLKSAGSSRFRKLRSPIVKIPIRFGLTGSPTGNALMNLWAEMFIVAGAEPLGSSKSLFRDTYFEAVDYHGYDWQPKKGAEPLILEALKPHAIYVQNARGQERAERISYRPLTHEFPLQIAEQYEELRAEYVTEMGGSVVHSPNAAVLSSKLKQLESGAVYKNIEPGEEPAGEWLDLHGERLKSTAELVDSLEGQQLLIFYEYDHERIRLQKLFKKAIHINAKGAVDAWNEQRCQLLLAHPASAGHGLNLHLGGAYNMLFFTSPWSWELAEQCMGRLDRVGQKRRVNVYHFSGLAIADDVVRRWAIHDGRQKRVKESVAI